jgi:hypothetical protein
LEKGNAQPSNNARAALLMVSVTSSVTAVAVVAVVAAVAAVTAVAAAAAASRSFSLYAAHNLSSRSQKHASIQRAPHLRQGIVYTFFTDMVRAT